jgi:hypothetical protein
MVKGFYRTVPRTVRLPREKPIFIPLQYFFSPTSGPMWAGGELTEGQERLAWAIDPYKVVPYTSIVPIRCKAGGYGIRPYDRKKSPWLSLWERWHGEAVTERANGRKRGLLADRMEYYPCRSRWPRPASLDLRPIHLLPTSARFWKGRDIVSQKSEC